jgi:GT2 family glycosyltransferase
MAKHRWTGRSGMTIVYPIIDIGVGEPSWPDAVWVGEIDQRGLAGERLDLYRGNGFHRARLLVWRDDQPRGFVEVAVHDGGVQLDDVRAAVALLPNIAADHYSPLPPISLVLCTRDRPDHLRDALESLTNLDYSVFEIIVVDNNPASGLTPPVVESFSEGRVRLVDAPGQGLSIARNAGVKSARYEIIAFTDDDVIVDHRWLTNLARGFARIGDVGCVCGMVPSAELLTPAQSYFDRRVGWARRCEPAIFDIDNPPTDDPLFPLHVAQFGTGANFAVRRSVILDVGGFDEGLGIGSPAGGGEDIDIFLRILRQGHRLVKQPSAVVWHRHRQTVEELDAQIYGYGLGLGAWIFKLLLGPKTFGLLLRRLRTGIRHLRGVTVVEPDDETLTPDPTLDGLHRRELRGVLDGPFALLRSRLAGRRAAPLKVPSTKGLRALSSRGERMWGDPGYSGNSARLAAIAVVLGVIGTLGAVQMLPSVVLAIAVAAFMFAGPGTLLLSWYAHLPPSAVAALIPAVSLAMCILVVAGLLMLGIYSPVLVLLGMTSATVVGGLLRCGYLARRERAIP